MFAKQLGLQDTVTSFNISITIPINDSVDCLLSQINDEYENYGLEARFDKKEFL